MKNFSLLMAGVILSGLVFFSCSKSEKTVVNSENETLSESLVNQKKANTDFGFSEKESFEIVKSKEAQKLITLQNTFLDKIKIALKKGYTMEELKTAAIKAVEKKDQKEFMSAIFGSEIEGNDFVTELEKSRKDFLIKFPFFEKNSQHVTCVECQKATTLEINSFFSKFKIYDRNRLKNLPNGIAYSMAEEVEEIDGGGPVCGSYWQQAKLIACAALCSASTVGVGTVLCGWACWCMLCPESVTGGVIC